MHRRAAYLLSSLAVFLAIHTQPVAANTYAEVVQGCTHLGGRCVNIRLGPGTDYTSTRTARIGTVLEVDGHVERGGYTWYKVKKDSFIRYPERAPGDWYIAAHLVRITEEPGPEYAKSPKQNGKVIIVDISSQRLYAYDNTHVFMNAAVSTGIKGTPTPKGSFFIFKKQPSRYMQGPLPGISEQMYDLPGVPWTMFFTEEGAAIHGAYWHNSFGTPYSHGCVNLPVAKAKKLYHWADAGTRVYVRK